jgi:hypothetical protein
MNRIGNLHKYNNYHRYTIVDKIFIMKQISTNMVQIKKQTKIFILIKITIITITSIII